VGNIDYLCGMLKYILDMMIGGDRLGLSTKLDQMDRKTMREVVKLTTKYCVDTFGINNRKKTEFVVSICKQRSGETAYGQYCPYDNKITIYYDNCPTIKHMVQTVIHEYAHYMQPIKSSYNKLLKEYGYDDHPMEIEAREIEKEYYKDCWNKIKNKI